MEITSDTFIVISLPSVSIFAAFFAAFLSLFLYFKESKLQRRANSVSSFSAVLTLIDNFRALEYNG